MVAIEAWWLWLAWPLLREHFSIIDPGTPGAGAAGRDLASALPGAVLVFYAPAAVMLLIAVLAAIGATRRFRAGQRDLVPACLVAAPFLGFTLQAYGGEGGYRAYLFALPWLAWFAAQACPTWRRLAPAICALGTCLLFAYFGQELVNRIAPDEVRAQTWYEQHAQRGSTELALAPLIPSRLTARYPALDPGGSSLLNRPAFRGHRLGSADLPRLERVAARAGPHVFLVLSRRQEDYGRLNGLLPKGSLAGLTKAVGTSSDFRLVYRRPTAWVYEYLPRSRPGARR
jgi:hypothetical protein